MHVATDEQKDFVVMAITVANVDVRSISIFRYPELERRMFLLVVMNRMYADVCVDQAIWGCPELYISIQHVELSHDGSIVAISPQAYARLEHGSITLHLRYSRHLVITL